MLTAGNVMIYWFFLAFDTAGEFIQAATKQVKHTLKSSSGALRSG